MALGKPNAFNGQTYSVKTVLKEGETLLDCAYFDVQKKVADKKWESVARVTDVNGRLVGVQTKVSEWDDKLIKKATLELRDKDERYFIEWGLGSNMGRGLANSVLNLSSFDDVRLSLYGQKDKESGKTYPSAALRQSTSKETVKWKFDPKEGEIPGPREFKGVGGKPQKDWSETEDFLIEKLKEFAEVVKAAAASAPKQEEPTNESAGDIETPESDPTPTPRGTTKLTQAVEEDDSSIPF